MKDLLIAAGVVAVLLYLSSQQGATLTATLTPAAPVPVVPQIPSSILLSGGYQVAPPLTAINSSAGLTPAALGYMSPAALPTVPAPPPTASPPPAVSGGLVGTVGTGGLPQGGLVRPGLSFGTGTTTVRPGYTAIHDPATGGVAYVPTRTAQPLVIA